MRSLLTVVLYLGSFCLALAQSESVKFGKVEESWVRMSRYEADTNAAAVILHDHGLFEIEFYNGPDFPFRRVLRIHQRFKILSEAGLDLAKREIYYEDKEAVTQLKAITFNMGADGKIEQTELSNKEVYDERVNDRTGVKKFSLPKAKVGSVLDITYSLIDPNSFSYINPWYFQNAQYPVIYSEYVTRIPDWFEFVNWFTGVQKVSVSNTLPYTTAIMLGPERYTMTGFERHYTVKNLPALKTEPYTTNIMDYLAAIRFQLSNVKIPGRPHEPVLGSWPGLCRSLLDEEKFGGQIKKHNKFAAALAKLGLEGKTPQEKASLIYAEVRDNVKWNNRYSIYIQNTLEKVWTDKSGRSGEINHLLTAFLQEAGFEAHPVLLSTRDHGAPQSTYPILYQFNHAITLVKIGETWTLLDATEPYAPMGMLPEDDLNGSAWAMIPDAPQWIEVKSTHSKNHFTSMSIAFNEEGKLSVNGFSQLKDYDAVLGRTAYKEEKKDSSAYILKHILDEYEDPEIKQLSVSNSSLDKPLVVKYEFSTQQYANAAGDRVYLRPLLHEGLDDNPFKQKERTYKVDFATPMEWHTMINILVPEGWELEEKPQSEKVNMDGATMVYLVNATPEMIQLKHDIVISQTSYEPEQYQVIRDFFDKIVSKHAEQLVFKRKT